MSDTKTLSPALDLTVMITLATALIYSMGWAYAYHWYGRFNLGIVGLEIPLEYFLMYGFWSIRSNWWVLFVYAVLVVIWIIFKKMIRPWLWHTAPIVVLLLFWLTYGLGGKTAQMDYMVHKSNQFSCYPMVRLGLRIEENRDAQIDTLVGQLLERDYRLLLQTKSLLVLIKPKAQTDPVSVMARFSSVDLMRLTPVNPGCHR